MTSSTDLQRERYRAHFEKFEKGLNGEASTEIHALRRSAIARFAELGFPTTSHEEWRFTNVAPIAKVDYEPVLAPSADPVTANDVERFSVESGKRTQLVFVDGHYSATLSDVHTPPAGVKISSLATALKNDSDLVRSYLGRGVDADNAFIALNTAFMQDGAFICVPDDTAIDHLIHLLYIATDRQSPFLSHPRNLILAGRNSRISVAESYVSLGRNDYLTDTVTEVVVGEHAVVEHTKLQAESLSANHVGAMHVVLHGRSAFTSHAVAFGSALARNNVTAVFAGEESECTLNGLSLSTGTQLIDNHTTIDHAMPRCLSHEVYKAILDGSSRGVFNGKIFVRKDAQKTDAKQTNRSLLLSDQATIDTKPQLEIFADDVRCTHGAAVGALDEEQVFYLRTRGIDEVAARDLLTFAFASDVINRIQIPPMRERLEASLRGRLRQGRLTLGA